MLTSEAQNRPSTEASGAADKPRPVFFDQAAWARRLDQWCAATALPGDRFDVFAANHATGFFDRYLRHTKGEWAGEAFILDVWERAVVRNAFGWKRADGRRRFRQVLVLIARKNGKTTLAAGCALYLAFAAGEAGAEVYCAATDKAQASIALREAKRMRAQSPALMDRTDAYKFNISRADNFSKLEVISADYGNKDGLNISGLIGDEFHAWKGRELHDVLHTATGARAEPMEIYTTTAGTDRESICYEMVEHARKVWNRQTEDHGFLPVLFEARPCPKDRAETDWLLDPATWAEANPGLGHTISHDYMQAEAVKAARQPRHRAAFMRYHLNIWTNATTVWLPYERWQDCKAEEPWTLADMKGRECWGALDLSATTDLTALALWFPPAKDGERHRLWAHFWMPADTLAERARKDGVPYDEWARAGLITATPGNVVDYAAVRRFITGGGDREARPLSLASLVNLREIGFDRWASHYLIGQLNEQDGLPCVGFGQGFQSMSGPAKEFEALVVDGKLDHGGNPVLDWMARTVEIKSDPAGNIKPVKPDRRSSSKRIDGIVAGIMALGRWLAVQSMGQARSIWDREELWSPPK